MNKLITYDAIMTCNPFYDLIAMGMPIDYKDTPINFINEYWYKFDNLEVILWIIRKLDLFTINQYQWFALGCLKMVKHLIKDKRSIKTLEVTEAYLLGNATEEELEIAIINAKDVSDKIFCDDQVVYAVYIIAATTYTNTDVYKAAITVIKIITNLIIDRAKIQTRQINLIIDILKTK